MKKIPAIVIVCLYATTCFSQAPSIKQWERRWGGDLHEVIAAIIESGDSTLFFAGTAGSDSTGDVSQHTRGSGDFWLLHNDANGNKLWDKLYGGLDGDELEKIIPLTGGFLLAGDSYSGIGGEVSEPNRDATLQTRDYWIIRTDENGNKLWDHRYGGTGNDYLTSVVQCADNGFLLGGFSNSPAGFEKTDDTSGPFDFWVVKTDSAGTRLWDKTFGGTDSDQLFSIFPADNGNFFLGGHSASLPGGSKTSPNYGYDDFWIVKIDSAGNMIWDKSYGGSQTDHLKSIGSTIDGNYVFLGLSNSPVDGNKTAVNHGQQNDFWLVKVNASGNMLWDKAYGGWEKEDELSGDIQRTENGSLVLSGTSYSPYGGDKTEFNLGPEQGWTIKVDSAGNKLWDKTFFTLNHEEDGFTLQTSDGCLLFASRTEALPGGYITLNTHGLADFWVIKLCDSLHTTGNAQPGSVDQFSIYPNPFSSTITIVLKQNIKELSFTIKNVLGQIVYIRHQSNPGNRNILNLDFLSNGMYVLELTADGKQSFKKIVRE